MQQPADAEQKEVAVVHDAPSPLAEVPSPYA
jgi:hypothetical protein